MEMKRTPAFAGVLFLRCAIMGLKGEKNMNTKRYLRGIVGQGWYTFTE